MKNIFTLLTLILATDSFSQKLGGTINFTKSNWENSIFEITAKNLNQNTDKVIFVKTDSLGVFNMVFDKAGEYQLSVNAPFEPDTTFCIKPAQSDNLELVINYPPKICPYDKTRLTGICPEGHHKDKVIPIVYGLVMGPRGFFRKVKKGKVELGGCIVTDCDPNWYCKTHDRRF